MKALGNLLSKKTITPNRKVGIDQQSVFYVFSLVIKEEYGIQGRDCIKPVFFQDKKIYIRITRSSWNEEIIFNSDQLIRKINHQLGSDEVRGLVIES